MIRKSTRPPLRINAPNEDVLGCTDHAGIGKWSVARRLTLVTHVDGASLFLGKAFLRQHPGSAGRAQRPAFLRHGAFRGELRDAQSGGSLTPLLPGPADGAAEPAARPWGADARAALPSIATRKPPSLLSSSVWKHWPSNTTQLLNFSVHANDFFSRVYQFLFFYFFI